MELVQKVPVAISLLIWIASAPVLPAAWSEIRRADQGPKRCVTVADTITMTQFAGSDYNVGSVGNHGVAQFSPDGKRFVILVKKGVLENNTNKYSLLLYKTDEALHSPRPEVLVSFSSNSNRPGIQETQWINNRNIAFLAENPGEFQQLYTVDCRTKRLTKLTNHATNLVSYVMSADGSRVFFLASRRPE